MAGSDWLNKEDADYKIGDKIWIIVDSVNNPTGRWKGEVVDIEEYEGFANTKYYSYKAIITDSRLFKTGIRTNIPTVNYRILPRNDYIDRIFEMVEKAEEDARSARVRAAIREGALKEAIVTVAGKVTEMEVNKIIEQAVERAFQAHETKNKI